MNGLFELRKDFSQATEHGRELLELVVFLLEKSKFNTIFHPTFLWRILLSKFVERFECDIYTPTFHSQINEIQCILLYFSSLSMITLIYIYIVCYRGLTSRA